jgi:hypothetical protein
MRSDSTGARRRVADGQDSRQGWLILFWSEVGVMVWFALELARRGAARSRLDFH